MVTVMVMNDLLPPLLFNVNRPSCSDMQLFQNLTMKILDQGHACGQMSRSLLTLKIPKSGSWPRLNPVVTFETWSSIDMFPFISWQLHHSCWDITNSILDLENSRSRSWSRSNPMVTFEALSPMDMFIFVSWQWDQFWLRYSKFDIWPWKFKVKVML